jgi:hypothetical protein
VHRTFKYHCAVAQAKAGNAGLTCNDLRGYGSDAAALAGANEPDIGAITGHSMADVRRARDHHYLDREPKMPSANWSAADLCAVFKARRRERM